MMKKRTLMIRVKSRTKQSLVSASGWLYRKNVSNPRILNIFKKMNDKFKVINSADELQSGYRAYKGGTKVEKDKILKKPKDLKVAVILDEFSYNSFKYEFEAIVIEKTNWLEKFQSEGPDIFFCESAWSGIDSKVRPWQGSIYASKNFEHENRTVLLEILDYCKKNEIPTVFWNKEDPSHYEDRVHDFVTTALLFDHIFTTDENCVARYKNEYGHSSVHSLMFATQPKMFNPIKKHERTDEVIFAGSWYSYHVQRCMEMEKILDGIISSGYELKIYDRYHGVNDPNHFYPGKYHKYINPALPFNEIEKAYKGSKYALNFTTVTDSPTMFARRVFELMSSGTYILSNHSVGIERLLGENICFVDGNDIDIDITNAENAIENNIELALTKHTYKNRFLEILEAIKYPILEDLEDVSVVYFVDDEDMLKEALKCYKKINYKDKECIIYLTNKFEKLFVKDVFSKYSSATVKVFSLDYVSKYSQITGITTKYFVVASNYGQDYIAKLILHSQYLESEYGVASNEIFSREKYIFEKSMNIHNVIFHEKMYVEVIGRFIRREERIYDLYLV